ncbi:MAG: hypothetical protein E3J72_22375 [Planctomycetota bacterium]|nr:MAG: hypothetical protein E3J72_22375 [Planctomycetota bacterium]
MLRILAFTSVFVICLSSASVAQDEIEPGEVVTLTCKGSSYSYYCYLPTKYKSSKKWPVLYCFSSDGNARPFIDKLFKDACEKHGWIVVAAKSGPNPAVIKPVLEDTISRFSVNEKRLYSSGFSAGSGVAFIMAEKYSDKFAGVIPMAMASTWARKTPDLPKHVAVYFIMGSRDSVGAVKGHSKKLQGKGNKTFVKVFNGGHQPPSKAVAEGAVEWLDKLVTKSSSSSGSNKKPTQLQLKEGLAKRLLNAVKQAARGSLAAALRISSKIIDDEEAKEGEKEDAEYIKDMIGKLRDKLFKDAAKLLKGMKPYEARELYCEIRKAFAATDTAKKARKKINEIEKDANLKDELAAGKLFFKALKYKEKGKKKLAKKYFEQVVKKYPDTEYAKRAKEYRE